MNPVAEMVEGRAHQAQKKDFYRPTQYTTKWEQMVAEKGVALAVVTLTLYIAYRAAALIATRGKMLSPTTMPPIIHQIDYRHDNET